MPDPYDPDWRPSYTGPDEKLGDVGSGGQFGVDLYHLYYAGRERLPKISLQYADMTTELHQTQAFSRGEFTRPDGSFHPAHALWMELRDELQEILRETSVTFWATGEALVETANDYARTDEEASAAFAKWLDDDEHRQVFPITALPPQPAPPAPGDHTSPPPPPPGEEEQRPPHLPPPPGEAPGDQDRSSNQLPDEE